LTTTTNTSDIAKRVLLAVICAVVLALPWLVGPYSLQLFILTMTYGMLGLSFAFTIRVGLPRFDSAAWWGIGAYTTAILMTKADMSFWLTVPIAGLVSMAVGYVVYRVAIPRGMMVFLMFGLVIALAIQQLFGSVEFFGGWGGTEVMKPPAIGGLVFDGKRELYYLGLSFLVVNLVCYYALMHSRIGRSWNAIGQSLKLASSVGIDVVRYRMANVLISNFFLALTGSFYMAFSLVAVPATFGLHKSLNVIMYVVIGGIAYSLAGPLVGALILAFVPEYMRVASEYESIITAVVIILVVIFLPGGILGWVNKQAKPWFIKVDWTKLLGRAKKPPGPPGSQ